MAAADVADRVADPVGFGAPGVVRGELQALDVHGVAGRVAAQDLGRPAGALGQQIADAFAEGDTADEFQDGGTVAPLEVKVGGYCGGEEAAGIGVANKAPLRKLE